MRERLQKLLAAAGVTSRRGAEELIRGGAVLVNGQRAEVGQSADLNEDEIVVNGRPLSPPPAYHRYLALNKPVGYVTSRRSTHGERTVMQLVPDDPRLLPVGRLDKDTSGLLLFSTDGEWTNLVTHPRHEIEKEYLAVVAGEPDESALERLRDGVELPDGTVTAPAVVSGVGRDNRGNARLSVTVVEGRKRQIRLMLAAVGHPIVSLRRIRVGSIGLGTLAEGRWRELGVEEVESVRRQPRVRSGPGRPRATHRRRD